MRILVFSKNAWSDRFSNGNTISNWFSDWPEATFYNVTNRNNYPENSVCSDYYVISDMDLVLKNFTPEKIGTRKKTEDFIVSTPQKRYKGRFEKCLVRIFRQHPSSVLNYFIYSMWKKQKWQNNRLDSFLDMASPDIFFSFLGNFHILEPMIDYIKRRTNMKIVLFASDDILRSEDVSIVNRAYNKEMNRLARLCVQKCDRMYGASTQLCAEYQDIFGVEIEPLYKGCDLSNTVKTRLGKPIKLVYAGNLLYGRDHILSILGKAICNLNQPNPKMVLEIYSPTEVTSEVYHSLHKPGSSYMMGSRPYDDIVRILQDADIVVHVESFNQESIAITRLSFSTKIIDCLQSGSVLLAIGPNEVASMQYIKGISGAIVINTLDEIENTLHNIMSHPGQLLERAQRIRAFAGEYHDIDAVREKLHIDFAKLIDRFEEANGENFPS